MNIEAACNTHDLRKVLLELFPSTFTIQGPGQPRGAPAACRHRGRDGGVST